MPHPATAGTDTVSATMGHGGHGSHGEGYDGGGGHH